MPDLPSWVQPGASFSVYYGKDNINNRRYQVREVVDGRAVVAQKGQRQEFWGYEVKDALWITYNMERGVIRRVKCATTPT